jgi:GT2 family glycosyltransferase
VLGIGTIFYGGNFAVRREALEKIGGFDVSIEFHGEDTNLGRRLNTAGKVGLCYDCYLYTSARRFVAMGNGAVFRLYVRNFTSELLHHRPKDSTHLDVRI